MLLSIATAREAMVLGLVLLILAALLGVVLLLYRRRYFSVRSDRTPGFTLGDIREMHRNGQLSDEEYERMRQAVIAPSGKGQDESGVGPGG